MTYIPRNSAVHRFDVRIKLLLLLAFSVGLFLVSSWVSMVIFGAVLFLVWVLSKIPARAISKLCVPLWIILSIILVCNSFTLDVLSVQTAFDMLPAEKQAFDLGIKIGVGASFVVDLSPVCLFGSFGFVPVGALTGLLYVVRIIFLFIASFLVVLSTTSEDLVAGLNSLMRPLAVLRIPTDDLATIFSIALRFIPLIAQEAYQIKKAQIARGAHFGEGGLWARIKAWFPVLIPLFVGLFRRADNISVAMDARCYGYLYWLRKSRAQNVVQRGRLRLFKLSFTSVIVGVFLFVIIALVVALLG